MPTQIRSRLTYSNVVASLALFVALGGAAVAATRLPKNSVGTKQLKPNAVTAAKLRNGTVNRHKLAHGSVVAGKLGAGSIAAGNLQNGSVVAAKLANGSVTNSAIANGVVGTNKLGSGVVTTVKLADGSVTLGKLGPEVGPLVGPLRSGQTLRGMFFLGLGGVGGGVSEGQSFQFPLENAPTANFADPASPTTACPGITGGNAQTPQAAPGQLCIYTTSSTNLNSIGIVGGTLTRLGFGLEADSLVASAFFVNGQWAVTAP
jgi:hypothetical protein